MKLINIQNNSLFILFFIGLVLIAFTLIWMFFLVPILKSIPTDYYRYEEQEGENNISVNGIESSKPFTHHNTQEIEVVNTLGNNLKVMSKLQAVNVDTGEKFLDETRIYDVDRISRMHQSIEKGYFLFPPNTEKHNYFITFPIGFAHAIYKFQGVDVIDGLVVYIFVCESEPYDITNSIPQFKESKVQSIYSCTVSVEPKTGIDIEYNLSWESYIIDNGEQTTLVEKGYKNTTPYFISKHVEEARDKKILFEIYDQLIPYVIGISGVISLLGAIISKTKTANLTKNVQLTQNVKDLEKIAKTTTNEIIKSAKLITLGQLSANISHDIRSGLQSINTAVELMEIRNNTLTDEDKLDLKQIKNIANKLDQEINNIMTFVRITPISYSKIRLNDLIDSIVKNIPIPSQIKIIRPKNDIWIYCDRNKIESVITNIIVNAIDAIPNGGTITINGEDDAHNSVISIQDSGSGIPQDKLQLIFEPLFTTKSFGTGLGLAICKNIISEHNGQIEVKNNPTTFKIILPKQN